MKRVLTNPDIVLQELKRAAAEDTQNEQLEQVLSGLVLQEKRLVYLYTVGGITVTAVREGAMIWQSVGRYWRPNWPRFRWLQVRASMSLTPMASDVP